MHKLFVSGFPLNISELELARLIAPHGDIDTIKIVRDRKTRICKGYAFVEMQTAEGAENVIEGLNDYLMGDRTLTLKLSEEKTSTIAPNRYHAANKSITSKFSGAPSTTRPKRPRKVL